MAKTSNRRLPESKSQARSRNTRMDANTYIAKLLAKSVYSGNIAMARVKLKKLKRNAMRIAILAAAIASIVLIAAGVAAIKNRMEENNVKDFGRERNYIVYTVGYNDTLWSISEDMASVMPEYESPRTYLRDLRTVNKLYSDKIEIGDKITLPYYSSTDAQSEILDEYGIA